MNRRRFVGLTGASVAGLLAEQRVEAVLAHPGLADRDRRRVGGDVMTRADWMLAYLETAR